MSLKERLKMNEQSSDMLKNCPRLKYMMQKMCRSKNPAKMLPISDPTTSSYIIIHTGDVRQAVTQAE